MFIIMEGGTLRTTPLHGELRVNQFSSASSVAGISISGAFGILSSQIQPNACVALETGAAIVQPRRATVGQEL